MSNESVEEVKTPVIGFQKERIDEKREDARAREKALNGDIAKYLETVHYITKINEEQKIAEVEDIKKKRKKAMEKLAKQFRAEASGQSLTNEAGGPSGDNIPVEAHPEIEDMGGMAPEIDDLNIEEYSELFDIDPNQVLDKTELENQLKNKLKARNELKMQNAPKAQPSTPAPKMTPTYEKKYTNVPPMAKPEPEEPRYRPTYTPTLKPPGA